MRWSLSHIIANQCNDLNSQQLKKEEMHHPKTHFSLKAHKLYHTICLLQTMFTLPVAWPQYGSPSVLAWLRARPSMAGPLFSTSVIFCALGMNSITMVACFVPSLCISMALHYLCV